MFQIVSNTTKYLSKEKNGDHLLHGFVKVEGLWIGIVADGVSKQPCDWYASELACQGFMDHFLKQKALPLPERIQKAILQTNGDLNKVEGPCQRLSSTLTVAVCSTTDTQCFIASVGDSRVYRIREGKLEQLSIDNVHRSTQTIMTSVGKRTVTVSNLTQVLGMSSSSLQLHVYAIDFTPGDLLILATDGFYDARKSFNTDILTLNTQPDLEASFAQLWEKFKMLANDDMTAVVINKPMISAKA